MQWQPPSRTLYHEASPKGAVYMALIEKTFGKGVTTRTWDTVAKLSRRAV